MTAPANIRDIRLSKLGNRFSSASCNALKLTMQADFWRTGLDGSAVSYIQMVGR